MNRLYMFRIYWVVFLVFASICYADTLNCEVFDKDKALKGLKVIFVKRSMERFARIRNLNARMGSLGYPSNHESHSCLQRMIYDNEIVVLNTVTGKQKTIYKPQGKSFVGHLDLHWDADRLLFTQTDNINWKIWEIKTDGTGLRQVSQAPDDIDCYEPCYLPDGRIIFASNAPFQCVPCWHGVQQKFVANLYVMNADGSGMRRLCFDQDHDSNPSVRNNGQVIYSRWDYTGINRLFLRPLMSMNPDGTGQRALYGSNSWFPNALYAPRELPGSTGRFLAILSGYHGSYKDGHLVIIDTNRGRQEEAGIVKRISGRKLPLEIRFEDRLTEKVFPKFMTPYPVTDDYFLVTGWMNDEDGEMGIYLTDSSDNLDLLYEADGHALLEPIPLIKRTRPPVVPDRIDLSKNDATVYIQDVYTGPGLANVPRGTVKDLRVISYHFGYIGLAGNDKIGLSGPWDAMRIIGTVPVEEDGSVTFRIPANTPLAFQALDGEGKAIQLMRTWFTAMPGESLSCIGCHESSAEVPPGKRTIAATRSPRILDDWYGPARGFDFEREVQPVLNKYCVSCHDGDKHNPDLRSEEKVPGYKGLVPGHFDSQRMLGQHKEKYGGMVRYTPAYEALINYIRRVNVGDDVSLLDPGHYHADTSELVQILQKGHYGVKIDDEGWSRIVTWIDLNGPCHGTWQDVFKEPVPFNQHKRRMELFKLYGGPASDPEAIPATAKYDETPVEPVKVSASQKPEPRHGYVNTGAVRAALEYRVLDMGAGKKIKLVNVEGLDGKSLWMSTCEISNDQFRIFKPGHSSRYYVKRHAERGDDQGMSLNESDQPVLRVSWNEAMDFCGWLSEKTGLKITLPTEEQWEQACLAGSSTDFNYGTVEDDFSQWGNMADRTFASFGYKGETSYFQVGGDVDYIAAEGVVFSDRRYDDKSCVTAAIGSYKPNAFGLFDMHGNAAEWTASDAAGEKILKGGSYLDRPARCSASERCTYPAWQKVYNAGFRIVIEE